MNYPSIPAGLSQYLPYPQTPWHVNAELFSNLRFTPDHHNLYKRDVVTEEHPEYAFVHAYFNNEIPQNLMIGRIFCIHNPARTKAFEQNLPSMEAKTKDPYFNPTWREGDPHPLREKVLRVWQEESAQFTPFCTKTKRADGSYRQEFYDKVKMLPLWHGSSEAKCKSIAEKGFVRFGKHDFVTGEGDAHNVDIGIFGDGSYFTNSAKYAAEVYGQGHLLLSWVSMREPFPIISHTKALYPDEPKDITLLKGQGGYKAHDAHYVHVTLNKNEAGEPTRDTRGKLCYYPITDQETPDYNEVVVFDPAQTLPTFWVELIVGLVRNPTLKLFSSKPKDIRLLELDQSLNAIPLIKQNRYPKPEEIYAKSLEVTKEDQEKLTQVTRELVSLSFIFSEFDTSHLKKVYSYVFCLFPFIEHTSIGDFLRANGVLQKLLTATPTLTHEQRKLTLHLAFWHIKQAELTSLERKLSLYRQAMSYFAIAIKLATVEEKTEMHRLASSLLLKTLRLLSGDAPHFREKLETAGRKNQEEEFRRLFSHIERLKKFCCQEDDKELIKSLYNLVIEVVTQILPPGIQDKYGPYVKEAYRLKALSFDIPTQTATELYQQELYEYRETFHTLVSPVREHQHRTFQQLQKTFAHILDDAFTILGPPPCAYDIRVLGSCAREEMTPFSDLKLRLFIEDESCKEYFRQLVQVLSLQLAVLGETASVNLRFSVPSVLGFHVNPEVSSYNDPDLVQHVSRREHFPQTTSLASYHILELKPAKQEALALACLQERLEDFQKAWKAVEMGVDLPLGNLKSQFADPLTLLLQDFKLYFGLVTSNSLDILQALQEQSIVTKKTAELLKEAMMAIYALRVQTQIRQNRRSEEITAPQHSREQLTTIYYLLLRPLYSQLAQALAHPPHLITILQHLDPIEDVFIECVKAQDPAPHIPTISSIADYLFEHKATQQEYARYFEILSKDPTHEPLRVAFFNTLVKRQLPQHLLTTLANMPNRAGQRPAYALNYEDLNTTLAQISDINPIPASPLQVKVVSHLSKRYLNKKTIDALLDTTGHLKKTEHTDSAHNVASTQGLYFKEMPAQPLMEYAVHNLCFRLGGSLTPTNELVRFEVEIKGQKIVYPVLISREITGTTLKEAIRENPSLPHLNHSQLTWLLLASILTRPGDGRLSNYIYHEDGRIFCIDNDISFIEPVVKKTVSKEINFCSALFCLEPHLLDPKVLEEFSKLDINAILEGWLTDIIETEKRYKTLFTDQETQVFYTQDPNNRFTPTILFKEGTLVTLSLQFVQLQKYLQSTTSIHSTDLLSQVVSILDNAQSSVGKDLYKAYTKPTGTIEEKLKQAVGRKKDASLTSAQHLQRTFAKIPTWEEIEKRQLFSPTKAKEELLSSYLNILGGRQLKSSDGKFTLQGDFSRFVDHQVPDEVRQNFVLKALHYLASQQDPTTVILRHCTILNRKTLEPFLNASLEHLDISYCSQIRSADITQIQRAAPRLTHLVVEGCDQLEAIGERNLFSTAPLVFEHLRELSAKKCTNLRSVRLKASQLQVLSLKKTERLEILELDSGQVDVDLTDSSCTDIRVSKEIALEIVKKDPMRAFCLIRELQNDIDIVALMPDILFGKAQWLKYFGDVGDVPSLPPEISQILASPCPFWPDKKVGETHKLVLIPKTVNGKPLTLNALGELVERPKQGSATKYSYVWDGAGQKLGDVPVAHSYWVLMTKDVIPGSRNKSYADQCQLVGSHRQRTKLPYEVPHTLEAATVMFLEYVQTGVHIYSREPLTYTRCQEKVDGYQMAVGGFAGAGLSVYRGYGDCESGGVGPLRKF